MRGTTWVILLLKVYDVDTAWIAVVVVCAVAVVSREAA
jgi:hypothetical protein